MNNSIALPRIAPDALLLWIVLITSETALQLLLKAAGAELGEASASVDWIAGVVSTPAALGAGACYLGTFVSWMLILRRTELSLAFPATALTYVSVLLGSHWVFGEPLEPWRYIGVALIVGGVSLLRE